MIYLQNWTQTWPSFQNVCPNQNQNPLLTKDTFKDISAGVTCSVQTADSGLKGSLIYGDALMFETGRQFKIQWKEGK